MPEPLRTLLKARGYRLTPQRRAILEALERARHHTTADEVARKVAEQTGAKYQAVLRRWLAEGASRARAERRRAK